MAQSKDHLSELDRHVQLLESRVNQLRASLSHWQQWYLEYSALKEEVEQLPTDSPPHEQLRRIRRDFDGKVLTNKEINEILGKNDLKQPEQIVSVLSRRMDYVEQNIGSLTKLIEKEENKLAAASVVAQPDAGTDEETGLPLTDIIEELDDDDNVVNFRLQSGSDVEPKIVEALKKAGIREKDLAEAEAELPKDQEPSTSSPRQDDAVKQPIAGPAGSTTSDTQESLSSDGPVSRKKSVSFAEDTKPGHNVAEQSKSRAAENLEWLMQKAREQEAMDMSSAVIPDDESEEDRRLRREMLEYGMSEIGPIVAELQIEEGDSGDEDDWEWDGTDDELEEEETDDDGEDELGRSKRSVISSDYIKRMQELETRLSVQSAFAVGGSETKAKTPDEGMGRIAVVGDSDASTASPKLPGKKSVSFAAKLDIAPDPGSQPPPDVKPKERIIAEVGDVVEKVAEPGLVKEPEEPPKRVSRFRKERATVALSSTSAAAALPPGPHQLPTTFLSAKTVPPAEPAPPELGTVASTIVERPTMPDPAEPDEMDDALLYKAAAVEYTRMRNKLIQKHGGFLQQDGAIDSETGLVPLDEELGGPKRMSKFKAARLTKLQ